MEDYYNLFPNCGQCCQLKLNLNQVKNYNYAQEIEAEAAYLCHLLKNHKLAREEIVKKTGVEY